MTISELINRLQEIQKAQGDVEVMVLDGFNGGGAPRTINMGPKVHTITPQDAEETGDCEEILGDKIALIGYGCY